MAFPQAAGNEPDLYEYIPLDHDVKSIRVLKLRPAEDSAAELCGEICELRLDSDDFQAYEAISYAWEGQSPDHGQFILCGQDPAKKISITRNSVTALRYLRHAKSDRVLWMDSICIDQSSVQDRNHQVNLMCDIYSNADRVLIWLGEDTSLKAGPTFNLLENLAKADADDEDERETLKGQMRRIFDISKSDRNEVYVSALLSEVFQRPWFSRMWTLQEITLSDPITAVAICGRHSMMWKDIILATERFGDMGLDEGGWLGKVMQLYVKLHMFIRCFRYDLDDLYEELQQQRKWRMDKPAPQASEMFTDCRLRASTDPRDKAFALQGLCSELGIKLPPPDYNKSVAQVFSEVTRAAIRHDEDLDVLFLVSSPRRLEGLPSWVPDWSDRWKAGGCDVRHKLAKFYRASPAEAQYSFSEDSRSLVVSAAILDTVSEFAKPIPISEVEDLGPLSNDSAFDRSSVNWMSNSYAVWEAVQSWVQLVSKHEKSEVPYVGDSGLWSFAFFRTLKADAHEGAAFQSPDGKPPFDAIHEELQSFISWYRLLEDPSSQEQYIQDSFVEAGLLSGPDVLGKEMLSQFQMAFSLIADEELVKFHQSVWTFNFGRTFFITKNGWMGTSGGCLSEGDVVAIVAGVDMPVMLSPVGEDYRLVGHCYVHEMMNGEGWPESTDELKSITIV